MKNQEENKQEIAIIDEFTLADKIYTIRGKKVMLDFELAEIYGYTTKAFNQQVKRNIDRFPEDFLFRLTQEETVLVSRSQNVTLKTEDGRGANIKYLPYAFTEQGIYMLMTVLRGELAVKQSKALIRTFKAMKDYVIENRNVIGENEYLRMSLQITDSIKETVQMRTELNELGSQMSSVMEKMSNVVERSEIAPFMLDMGKPAEKKEYLFFNGQPLKAATLYIDLYSSAEKSIYIIDNYISTKTLHLLQEVKDGVDVVIFSDNIGRKLRKSDIDDFNKEFPNINLSFCKTNGAAHDRFIILDYKTKNERLFHCGASSKDAGYKITAISELRTPSIKEAFHSHIEAFLKKS